MIAGPRAGLRHPRDRLRPGGEAAQEDVVEREGADRVSDLLRGPVESACPEALPDPGAVEVAGHDDGNGRSSPRRPAPRPPARRGRRLPCPRATSDGRSTTAIRRPPTRTTAATAARACWLTRARPGSRTLWLSSMGQGESTALPKSRPVFGMPRGRVVDVVHGQRLRDGRRPGASISWSAITSAPRSGFARRAAMASVIRRAYSTLNVTTRRGPSGSRGAMRVARTADVAAERPAPGSCARWRSPAPSEAARRTKAGPRPTRLQRGDAGIEMVTRQGLEP